MSVQDPAPTRQWRHADLFKDTSPYPEVLDVRHVVEGAGVQVDAVVETAVQVEGCRAVDVQQRCVDAGEGRRKHARISWIRVHRLTYVDRIVKGTDYCYRDTTLSCSISRKEKLNIWHAVECFMGVSGIQNM